MKFKKLIEEYLSQKSNPTAQIVVAAVAGLAAGAVISILMAPAKGSNTRKNISDRSKRLGSELKDSYASLLGRNVQNNEVNEVVVEPKRATRPKAKAVANTKRKIAPKV